MNKLYILLALTALAGSLFSCDSNIYNASMPMTLDIPNHVYCMVEDVDANNTEGYALTVAKANVTIDCQGWSITGDGTGTGIYSDQNGTIITNCPAITAFAYGITLSGTQQAQVMESTITSAVTSALYLIGVSQYGTFNHLTLTGTGGAYALDMELGGNDGYNVFGNSTMTSDIEAAIYLSEANSNTFENISAKSNEASAIYISLSTNNHITNSIITSTLSNGFGFNTDVHNNTASNNTIVAGNLCFDLTGSGGMFFGNNCTSDLWVSDSSELGNTFNDSTSGNIWNLADGTPASADCDISGTTWATSGTDLPFSNETACLNGTYWVGNSFDAFPWAGTGGIALCNLTVVAGTGGTATGSQTDMECGEAYTAVNATASEGYAFDQWGLDGDCELYTDANISENNVAVYSGECTATAAFTSIPTPPTPINVNYTNYSTPNVTGFGSAFDYSKGVMTTATGWADAFGLMVLGTIFICFYIIGSRYTQERALVYSMFMVVVVAFLMVSGNFLDPKWLILSIVGLLASVYFAGRVSQ